MPHSARAVIDLSALSHNLRRVRELAPDRRVMACIKADAYGHGLVPVGRALDGAADALAVARLDEALELRAAGVQGAIVLLEGVTDAEELASAQAHDLDLVVHVPEQLALMEQVEGPATHVWLKLDSGMGRLGFPLAQAVEARDRLLASGRVRGELRTLTHLACADEEGDPTVTGQIQAFDAAVDGWTGPRSIANSAGVCAWPQSHARPQDWVRPGLMLYGISPLLDRDAFELGLRPVMRLSAGLIAVKTLASGDRVGYGGSYTCPEEMPVGIVGIGYGDGYPWRAFQGGHVLLDGRPAPLIGRVSMDMCAVDLRQHPRVSVGDEVLLWGEGLPVEQVACWVETIPYELVCGVTRRVPFEYA